MNKPIWIYSLYIALRTWRPCITFQAMRIVCVALVSYCPYFTMINMRSIYSQSCISSIQNIQIFSLPFPFTTEFQISDLWLAFILKFHPDCACFFNNNQECFKLWISVSSSLKDICRKCMVSRNRLFIHPNTMFFFMTHPYSPYNKWLAR